MCSNVSGTLAPSGLTGQPVQPTDELSEALSQKKWKRTRDPHACAHMCTFTHMHNTHVHVHTYNQTDPLFLPAKAAADLLFKTNELGSWALELNGTQLL